MEIKASYNRSYGYETARIGNTLLRYENFQVALAENRMSINELQIKLAVINHTLIETMSEIKFVKYTIAVLTDALARQ